MVTAPYVLTLTNGVMSMNGQQRCKSCGEPLPHKAKQCSRCGAPAPSGGFGGLGKLVGGALDMAKEMSGQTADEHGGGYGYQQSGGGALQTMTFQSKHECEQWRYQMGPNVQIVNVQKNKQHDMFGSKRKTYVVTYRTYGQQAPPQQQPSQQPMPPQAPPQQVPQHTAASSDVTEQIKKLAELHDQGILTDEEFQTKKKELLAKL